MEVFVLCPAQPCGLQVKQFLPQPPLGPFKKACAAPPPRPAMFLFIMAAPRGLLRVALVLPQLQKVWAVGVP